MIHFSKSIEIAAPPERVWSVMRDVERWHEWTQSVTSVRFVKSTRLETGARVMIKQPKFPPAFWTLTEINEGSNFKWISTGPGLHVTANHSVAAGGSGTRATLSLEYRGVVAVLLAKLTRGITERYLHYEANGLKARSEALAASSTQ